MNTILPFKHPSTHSEMIGTRLANSLEDHIEEVRSKRIKVALRLEPGVVGTACPEIFHTLTAKAIENAIKRSPVSGEILISVAKRAGRLEVEIADDGDTPEDSRFCAFQNQPSESDGIFVRYANCPQGGLACTLGFQPAVRQSIAA